MGVLCSTFKDGDESQEETKIQTLPNGKPSRRSRLRKMQLASATPSGWRAALDHGLESPEAYERARMLLQAEERARAFDAEVIKGSSNVEDEAVGIVRKIRMRDWQRANGPSSGNRTVGQHFLGNVDLINQTDLMRVAKKLPKGAHLHIHFNSCLPANFLIGEARNIDAMYIRSNLPLTEPENWDAARISFMVMTPHEATNPKGQDGVERHVPLGNCFDPRYEPNTWMSYKRFLRKFALPVPHTSTRLKGIPAAEKWLETKMQISEEEAHGTHQTGRGIWEKFNYRTQMMKGLFAYESAFRKYTRACIKDFVDDNIQYAEIRPNFMATNSLKTDDGARTMGNEEILRIINEELQNTMAEIAQENKYFGGMKVIYCTPRSFCKDQVQAALDECIDLKQKYSDLICGFDLLGHEEMGNELCHFVPELLSFRKKCDSLNLEIPFIFHCGETLQVGDKVDGNLFDAILLKSKRIGHGYALARHPLLMDIFKEKNIAVESCPISNEILGLTPHIAGHNLPILLANNVPCTINSDNATFYKSSLSHDFYQVMVGSESMTLLGWKQLAKWSLEHSCMDPEQLQSVTAEWEEKWDLFCHWIVDVYGADMENWKPSQDTVKALRLDSS